MKILITGAYGQLGSEIKEFAPHYKDWQFLYTDIDTLDITDEAAILSFFKKESPDFVINCAAYTAVDKAEEDKETAYAINATSPGLLAKASKDINARFIHVSTDYVFDGKNYQPYVEDDNVNPQSVYGKSKLEGEKNCLEVNTESLIIRTSWLYSSYGNNFVKTMLKLGKERKELNVVYDQVGSPTYAGDLAKTILQIIEKYISNSESFVPGIYHYSNEGVTSWYDFALTIFDFAGINCKVLPILTKDFPRQAQRPHFSVLNKSKIRETFGVEITHWKDSLRNCVEKLQNQG